MDLGTGVLLVGAGQGLILSALLLAKTRGTFLANRLLAGVIALLSLAILLHTLAHGRGLSPALPHEALIGLVLCVMAPLILFYVRSLTRPAYALSGRDLFYFCPVLLCLMFEGLVLSGQTWLSGLIQGVSFALFALAIVLGLVELHRFTRLLENNFSGLQRINLLWLRTFLLSLLGVWLAGLVTDLFFKGFSWDWIWLAVCLIIYLIGYFGFAQPQVFSTPLIVPPDSKGKSRKYQKSVLTDDLAAMYLALLEQKMAESRCFLDKDLSLAALAERVGLSAHHLSQLINERLGLSFYDYINGLRIGAAMAWLKEPSGADQSIAAIAFAAGFNSLSVFNAAFKRHSGQTPTQYRLRH